MKLGIFMLLFGLIIAAVGAGLWFFSEPTFLGYRSYEAQQNVAFGLGGVVFGGGLAIGGLVRMIAKR
jgi:hypothetical protein